MVRFVIFAVLLRETNCKIDDFKSRESNGSVVQLVRMPPCHGGGRGFESRPVRKKPPNWVAFSFLATNKF